MTRIGGLRVTSTDCSSRTVNARLLGFCHGSGVFADHSLRLCVCRRSPGIFVRSDLEDKTANSARCERRKAPLNFVVRPR
jgi:hypothetical protein